MTAAQHGFRRAAAIATIAAAMLAGNPAVAAKQDGGPPPTAVLTAEVVRRPMQDRVRVTGEVRAAERSTVAADVEGRVIEVLVNEGDAVTAGTALARIDDRSIRLRAAEVAARRRVADAVLDGRAAEAARARLDLERLQKLAEDRASRPRELDDARTAVAISAARLAEAEADRGVLDAQAAILADELADATIVAPFDGIVVDRLTDPGRWMERGGPVVELIGTTRFEIWLNVPQRLAPMLAGEGAAVGARVDAAGRAWDPVSPIRVPLVNRDARSFPIYLPVTGDGGTLADGMSAAGFVPAGRTAEHLLVPRDALLQSAAGFHVFVARPMGEGPTVAMAVPVRLLFDVGRDVAIEGGLGPGEQVIVEGNERLFPMMPVAPTPRTEPTARPTATAAEPAVDRLPAPAPALVSSDSSATSAG